MSNQGDDCYYYFYSSCTKGDSCTFRHCEAAIGNETVCTLWEEGRCFRQVCKFRHMKIDKKRSEIPCYWETQPSGCQKANCAFHHTKERYVDGNFLPPSKNRTFKNVLESSEDGVKIIHHSLSQTKLSTLPNASTHLRGVIKVDNETVPSPTHPPVVINAAADDDDDDDLFSDDENCTKYLPGENHNGQRAISPLIQAPPKKGGHVSIGKRSLNPVKSKPDRRGHLANAVPSGLCTDSAPLQDLPGTEKNIRSVLRTVTLSAGSGDEPCSQLTLAERLAKCRHRLTVEPTGDDNVGSPLKRSLAERLGRKIKLPERSENEVPQQNVNSLKSVKERLGFPSDMSSKESVLPAQPLEEIRIKTLKEIKLEKLSQKPEQAPYHKVGCDPVTEDPNNAKSDIRIKSFVEVLAEKKLRQMEEAKSQTTESRNSKQNAEDKPQNMPTHVKLRTGDCEAQQVEASAKKRVIERVRVKTLEEIKREKALRQQKGVENAKKAISVTEPVRGRRIRLGGKTNAVIEEKLQTETSVPAAPRTTPGDVHQTCLDLRTNDPNSRVLVKSFEEIMREKRKRKQQEAAEQLLKEKTLQEPSPLDNESAKGNSHLASSTATEEPFLASGLLQERSHHSSPGKNKKLPLRKRRASSLKGSQTAPVQDQQPSPLRSLKLSSPTKPLEPLSPVSPHQPGSLENSCQPSTPEKPHLSLPARTQHPVLLPLRSQQLSSPVKPQQPTSPIKPQQSSLQVLLPQPSSPLRFPHSSIQICSPQPSSPVKPHHQSSPAKDQQSSLPITASQQVVVQLQQPSKAQTQQLPQMVPKDLSNTEIVQEMTDTLSTEEDSTMADKTGQATKKGKGKPKASIKPSIGRKQALPKGPQKRKGAKSDHAVVAAVKPLSPSTSTTLSEPPAKKAALAIVGSSSIELIQSPRTCLQISTESMAFPEVQQTAPAPVAEMGSPESLPPSKIRRTSSSAPKTPLPAEDEFEKLMWELSGGRLEEEAEIDLDAGKDEDDLLLELSEMIDS